MVANSCFFCLRENIGEKGVIMNISHGLYSLQPKRQESSETSLFHRCTSCCWFWWVTSISSVIAENEVTVGHRNKGATQDQSHWCYLLKTGLDQVLREHVPVGDTENRFTSGKHALGCYVLYVNRIETNIAWVLCFLIWLLLSKVSLALRLISFFLSSF